MSLGWGEAVIVMDGDARGVKGSGGRRKEPGRIQMGTRDLGGSPAR